MNIRRCSQRENKGCWFGRRGSRVCVVSGMALEGYSDQHMRAHEKEWSFLLT
jgi:hypothetical protein